MLRITDDNYEYYKQVFKVLWKFNAEVSNIDPNHEYSPINVLNSWERKSKSLAKKGLKEGLTDMIIMSMDLPANIKDRINYQLTFEGLSTLNKLISIVKDTFQKVLKRDKIRNIDEYYIVKELLDDDTASDEDKKHISRLILEFEMNYKK